ncbi:sensor histidine kinase [Paenibacillus sp. 1P07SE]|uniref:sensor histidine kinase n=1 Tax=Paenibacillus sp. 1P07SE TaxID=3132209 RepID=UPI0039A55EC2
MKLLMRVWPSRLKYRLFFAFLLLILIPYSLLQLYSYRDTERLITRSVAVQAGEQLNLVKQSLAKLKSGVFLTMLQLETNTQLIDLLRHPDHYDEQTRGDIVMPILSRQEMNTGGSQAHVHYHIADRYGNLYSSLTEGRYAYDTMMASKVFKELTPQRTYVWVIEDSNDLPVEVSGSRALLSLYNALFDEDGEAYGYYKFAIDFEGWLFQLGRELLIHQKYAVLNDAGVALASTGDEHALRSSVRRQIIADAQAQPYVTRMEGQQLIGAVRLPQLGWTIVSQFPMAIYFGDLEAQRSRILITSAILTVLFIGITFFISSTITRPVSILQRKLQDFVPHNMKTTLPENAFHGEMRFLAASFNRMVKDIQRLIGQLKTEERQKEAIRFQMLLSQMNPHFLLNTLNVIRWNVLSKQDEETADICIALAKLLETSLNLETELIYLKQEMELVKAYVHIQNFRFDHRHAVLYDVPQHLDYVLVPKLCLQPLVENAYQHGFHNMRSGGVVTVKGYTQQEELILEISNNGTPFTPGNAHPSGTHNKVREKKRPGIGLANIKERLQLLFRESGKLEIMAAAEGNGTVVRIRMPLLLSVPYDGGDADVERADRRG